MVEHECKSPHWVNGVPYPRLKCEKCLADDAKRGRWWRSEQGRQELRANPWGLGRGRW